jgi:hypothetical protein
MTDITWYKRFHGTWKDPKFKAAAVIAGADRCQALSVWDAILEESSESDARGAILKVDRRVIAAGLDLTVDVVTRIWEAFVSLGMIAAEKIAAWAKRQGAAVVTLALGTSRRGGARRTADWRDRKAKADAEAAAAAAEAAVTAANREPLLPGLNDSSVTCDADDPSHVTTDLDSDKERIPPGPPKRGAPPGSALTRGGATNARQVEILMPIQGGRDGKRRRETADDRRMRECKEAMARAVMAGGLASHGAAASTGADDRDIFSPARHAAGSS